MDTSIPQGFCGAVGNTKLVKLPTLSKAVGCDILVKLEYSQPGFSIKDRAALGIINKAKADGYTKLVEATAGNTGISLALMARPMGMTLTCVCPDKTSDSKIKLLRTLGAEVVVCPSSATRGSPEHFQTKAPQLALEQGAFYCNQFSNIANFEAHFNGTGPEIFAQTGGRLDAVALATGTGGTLAGVSQYLKSVSDVKCFLCNTSDSGVIGEPGVNGEGIQLRRRTPDEAKGLPVSGIEGIGSGLLYDNLARAKIDGVFTISDPQAIAMCRWLLKHEGFFVGGSAGLNVCGAVLAARLLGPGHRVVTVLCDDATRYIDKYWTEEALKSFGLSETSGDDLSFLDDVVTPTV